MHPHHEFLGARIKNDLWSFDKCSPSVHARQIRSAQRDAFALPVVKIRRGIARHRATATGSAVLAIPVINVAVQKNSATMRLYRIVARVKPDFARTKFVLCENRTRR